MRTETVGVTETLIESAKKEFLEHGWTFFGGGKASCRRTYGVVS